LALASVAVEVSADAWMLPDSSAAGVSGGVTVSMSVTSSPFCFVRPAATASWMKDAAAEPAGIAIVTFVAEASAAVPVPAVDAELPEVLLDPPALLQPVTTRATTAPAAATHHLYRFMHPSFFWLLDRAVDRSCPRTWASGCACLDFLFV
jgi:hypothetical protein